jgi:hypothetical protein
VERAWKSVHPSFELEERRRIEEGETSGVGVSSKWTVLAFLRDKALKVRESLGQRAEEQRSGAEASAHGQLDPPVQIPEADQTIDLAGVFVSDDMLWDQGPFAIWDAVADDLSAQNHEIGGFATNPAA